MDADARGLLHDAGADLEQVLPEGRELGPGERHPAGHGIAQGEHQPVGRSSAAGAGLPVSPDRRERRETRRRSSGPSSSSIAVTSGSSPRDASHLHDMGNAPAPEPSPRVDAGPHGSSPTAGAR